MKKLFSKVAIIMACSFGVAYAQQDPQFTQWMHNKLVYNPGVAGTSGGYCGALQFRKQWSGFDGAPTSINFTGDMKLQNLPLGVGLTFINDKIGPMSTNFVRVAGAWNHPISRGILGVGLDVGIVQKSISNTWIVPEPGKIDPTIPGAYEAQQNPDLNKMTYDLGFGAYYTIPGQFYVGLSSSHLPAQTVGSGDIKYDLSRHFYLMTGYTYSIDPRSSLTPNIKYKSDLAAGALDVNLTYAYSLDNKKFWGGATYRLEDAAALMIGYQQFMNGTTTIKGGLSYDLVLSKLKGHTPGSFEVFLGACYTPKPKKTTTYETDRFY
jgi:type IX secretion system PorP/SprF family membrane protein